MGVIHMNSRRDHSRPGLTTTTTGAVNLQDASGNVATEKEGEEETYL